MAFEQRDNSGAVFKNNKKEKESHPDRTGTAMIGGIEYYVSGWIKNGANGQFLSLAFKPKESKPDDFKQEADKHFTKKPTSDDFDSDLPF